MADSTPAKAEARGESVAFEYDGDSYIVPPPMEWDVDVLGRTRTARSRPPSARCWAHPSGRRSARSRARSSRLTRIHR